MAPASFPLRARADDVAVHERDRGFASHELLEPHRPGVVDAHHHLVLVDGTPVRRVEQNAAVPHHRACAVPLPSAGGVLLCLLKDSVALVDGLLHVLDQVLHHLGLKPPILHPALQQHSHLGPEGLQLGVVEYLHLPARHVLAEERHEHRVPVPAL